MPAILAAAANCATGTPWQQYVCSHPGSDAGVAHAGYVTGQAMGPVLIGLIVLAIIIAVSRKSGSRKAAAASK